MRDGEREAGTGGMMRAAGSAAMVSRPVQRENYGGQPTAPSGAKERHRSGPGASACPVPTVVSAVNASPSGVKTDLSSASELARAMQAENERSAASAATSAAAATAASATVATAVSPPPAVGSGMAATKSESQAKETNFRIEAAASVVGSSSDERARASGPRQSAWGGQDHREEREQKLEWERERERRHSGATSATEPTATANAGAGTTVSVIATEGRDLLHQLSARASRLDERQQRYLLKVISKLERAERAGVNLSVVFSGLELDLELAGEPGLSSGVGGGSIGSVSNGAVMERATAKVEARADAAMAMGNNRRRRVGSARRRRRRRRRRHPAVAHHARYRSRFRLRRTVGGI